ncbi:glutathione s-transferase [Dactylonectria estremocensis]|uniref:Glutathione s-transferase n=1 Tax=Dactylonectria estremocensis TaxID=1079267 RepID=A0A9P9J986_9HYPO|nr:glutathione s-transferase [Dactylonectria estremocensis]
MPLIVHHLQVSQSERIPWVCEELGIDYELKTYKRAPVLAPPEYKALHQQGTAPVIQDGDLTLAESCACIEYICHKYGDGRLFLHHTDPAYADFLYWWHWADGTFQAAMSRAVSIRSGEPIGNSLMAKMMNLRFGNALRALDERVRDNKWLVGGEFTAADVMVVFLLTTMRNFYPYSLGEYENTLQYLKRVSEREAYKKALSKSDPDMELVLGPEPPVWSPT